MKHVKFLIKEARDNTNSTDKEAISDEWAINNLNRCQAFILSSLYNKNVRSKLFRKEQIYDGFPSSSLLPLPIDIYAKNAVINLRTQHGNHVNFLRQLSEENRSTGYGYIIEADHIRVSPNDYSYKNYVLTYAKKFPKFGLPFAKVISVTGSPSSITIDSTDELSDLCEEFCIVNKLGDILYERVRFEQSGDSLSLEVEVMANAVDCYIIPGEYSTTHSPLPEELYEPLCTMLETLIMARQSSTDIEISKSISDTYIDSISELFTDNTSDDLMPPVSEWSEWV